MVIEYPIVVAMWEKELIRYRLRRGRRHRRRGPHLEPAAWVFTVHAAEGGAPSVTTPAWFGPFRRHPGQLACWCRRSASRASSAGWAISPMRWGGGPVRPNHPRTPGLSRSVRDWVGRCVRAVGTQPENRW